MRSSRNPPSGARGDGSRRRKPKPSPDSTASKASARRARVKRGVAEAAESGAPPCGPAHDGANDSETFLAEFAEHWRLHGKAAFDAVCAKDPARYLALAAKLFGGDGARAEKTDLVALLAGLDERRKGGRR